MREQVVYDIFRQEVSLKWMEDSEKLGKQVTLLLLSPLFSISNQQMLIKPPLNQ